MRKKDAFSTSPTGRFAPSPTGRMHLGNVFGALLSWLSVKSKGGRWLLLSSPQQIYVGQLLGFHTPDFIHFPLLVNEAGQRLSKRDRCLDMGELRQRHTPQEIIGMLAFHAGLQEEPQPVNTDELIKKIRMATSTMRRYYN